MLVKESSTDDSNGNLRDKAIGASNFASSSRNFFYMSFNSMYKSFTGGLSDVQNNDGDINYLFNESERNFSISFIAECTISFINSSS